MPLVTSPVPGTYAPISTAGPNSPVTGLRDDALAGGIQAPTDRAAALGRIVVVEHESGRVPVREPVRRGAREAHAVVEREAPIHLPAVLREPLEQIDDVACRRAVAAFGSRSGTRRAPRSRRRCRYSAGCSASASNAKLPPNSVRGPSDA